MKDMTTAVHWAVYAPDGKLNALTTNRATAAWLVEHRESTSSSLPWHEWRIESIEPIACPEDVLYLAPTGGRYYF